jgi:copper type II ascorbate-dependent monooxygenase-like protein
MNSRSRILISLTLILGAGLVVFSSVSAASGRKEVTFNKDVAPIFYSKCIECHRSNDIAPMSLVSYKEVRPWARSIKEKVVTREMPPWSPDPKYGQFKNDHRLNQEDIDTIVAWVDQGAKEGEAKELVPAPEFASGGWQLGQPDVVIAPKEQYTVQPNTPDTIQNFIVPSNLKEDKWVTAAEILPGNKRIVHHVIAFIQTPEMVADFQQGRGRARAMLKSDVFYRDGTLVKVKADAPVVDDGCGAPNGGSAFPRPSVAEGGDAFGLFLAGYAPGKGLDVFPAGTAVKLPAGSIIVFQMHYSSFRGKFDEAQKDNTRLGLHFAKTPPSRQLHTVGIQNHYFKIPAGNDNHEVTACYTFDSDIHITGYMPHMHLRGKDMRYDAIYPDGRRETLLSVPKFSFNWQTMYYLKNPVLIPKGTKVIVTAHFDNSTKNKYNPDATKDIRWGDPTYEEMMIGWFNYYVDSPTRHDPAATAKGASEKGGE